MSTLPAKAEIVLERPFIVAEITVNWPQSEPMVLISQRFESVIAVNNLRGYDLVSHSHAQVVVERPGFASQAGEPRICETIVAVFRKRDA